ncbi:GNAT family N-acetyltransferase [Fervidobacterium thailandense]|uniref:GCN5 family acetyltransferase n=1 Tax=Fervidobacterium thailandense TaxID=1008305 RepID=A0A1E3G1F3_9BACT|nr:GNAT family N-acetyltransferase [Fervidobacterium thailandense]ODN29693.1 GCN5 family acetyltransferase [Fervidobacterium thailandense]
METIRRAEPSDADVVASLVLETGQRFLPLIFGPHVKLILGKLIRIPGTILYIDNIYVLEGEDRKVVGAIVAFPGKTIRKRSFKTMLTLFRIMGFELFKRLPNMILILSRNKVRNDEFYISNIAVDKSHRGKGFGSKLMKFAEKLASNVGAKRIVLDVENTNINAIELYKKLGYRGVTTKRVYIKGQRFVFIRMVKDVKKETEKS